MIERWVALWSGDEAPWSLALLRVALGVALLVDVVGMWPQDLVDALFVSADHGGLVLPASGRSALPGWWWWLGDAPWTGRLLHAGMVTAALGLATGTFTRSSAALWVVLSAQFADLHPAGDRGIDMMVRNVAMILAASGAGAALSVDAWSRGAWTGAGARVARWPRRLILLQLVVMYCAAGVSKYAQQWWPWGDFLALWVIWQDWAVSGVAGQAWVTSEAALRFSQGATALTILWELTFPVMLWLWARRAGPVGWIHRRRPDLWYVAIGACFHLGIAVWLDLGLFPWAMLALYPAFVLPLEWEALMDTIRRRDLSIIARALQQRVE